MIKDSYENLTSDIFLLQVFVPIFIRNLYKNQIGLSGSK